MTVIWDPRRGLGHIPRRCGRGEPFCPGVVSVPRRPLRLFGEPRGRPENPTPTENPDRPTPPPLTGTTHVEHPHPTPGVVGPPPSPRDNPLRRHYPTDPRPPESGRTRHPPGCTDTTRCRLGCSGAVADGTNLPRQDTPSPSPVRLPLPPHL